MMMMTMTMNSKIKTRLINGGEFVSNRIVLLFVLLKLKLITILWHPWRPP
jgi:hypothetical protein